MWVNVNGVSRWDDEEFPEPSEIELRRQPKFYAEDFVDVPDGHRRVAVAVCGTRSAYQKHRAAGEEPCEPCREANTAYRKKQVAAKAVGN